MLLAVDAGNTNVVFALVDADRSIRARWRIATDPRRTADEYVVWLNQLLMLEGYSREDVEAVVIGTVVPRALHNLEVLAQKYFGTPALVAGRDLPWGIALDVDEPDNVGADRALNVIAAHAKYDGDLVIVDFGTATTFDVADYSGAYKGGIIAPGINLSLDALVGAAAKLPRIAIQAPDTPTVIGRTTVSQMQIGIFWGYVAMIEGLVARMRAEIGRPARVIATGGLAVLFEQHSDAFDVIEPDLTIQGLAILWQRRHIQP
ncbi:type III pantothenate kinase [Sphingomonas sp.]|uniref:type III pantothenate kinase n=1 Tax=Sphingomonas sp. TaxID=28214 RepID=UPI002B55775A|nr:type III pantothenate kinase [Sphingomonas sp.]HTG39314.1 type III pantothenate kinase [Sphingomonas sp.]